jgi:acyl-CoA thioester hydrolase
VAHEKIPLMAERTGAPQRGEFRFWTEEKLRNADTDQFRHVNNAIISTLLEAARMEIFGKSNIRVLMGDANLAVVRLLIEFRSELYFPGHVAIGSTVTGVGKTSFRVRQGVFANTSDACAASADATCVLVMPYTATPHPINAELRAYLLAEATEGDRR